MIKADERSCNRGSVRKIEKASCILNLIMVYLNQKGFIRGIPYENIISNYFSLLR